MGFDVFVVYVQRPIPSFSGSAWERTVRQALPAGRASQECSEAEPREQCVPRLSLGTRCHFFFFFAAAASAFLRASGSGWSFLLVGRTTTRPPLGPGTAPRTSRILLSASIFTMFRLRIVTGALPYWPAAL